jgi:hypothetical protein
MFEFCRNLNDRRKKARRSGLFYQELRPDYLAAEALSSAFLAALAAFFSALGAAFSSALAGAAFASALASALTSALAAGAEALAAGASAAKAPAAKRPATRAARSLFIFKFLEVTIFAKNLRIFLKVCHQRTCIRVG